MAAILVGWIGMRAVLWEPMAAASVQRVAVIGQMARPAPRPHSHGLAVHPLAGAQGSGHIIPTPANTVREPVTAVVAPAPILETSPILAPSQTLAPSPSRSSQPPLPPATVVSVTPAPDAPPASLSATGASMRPRLAAAHQLMWLAAVSNLPAPQELIRAFAAGHAPNSASPPAPPPSVTDHEALAVASSHPLFDEASFGAIARPPSAATFAPLRRWSADGWLLLRKGGELPTPGSTAATYGAAQAGAVLRYHLVPASRFRPTAYVRGYAALNGSGEREAGAGLSARLLPGVPIAILAEIRASRFGDGSLHARPAALMVSEFPPLDMPLGLKAETYLEGGYVGGRLPTGFIDGQFKLDHAVLPVSRGSLAGQIRAGLGVWGGQQRKAARLDIGPSLTMELATGTTSARLAADWRFQISGNASPKSGPALTVSAGF